jgi:transposase
MSFSQEKNRHSPSDHRHGPFCPFKKFCVFLGGESPEGILSARNYLRQRVDELEFSMDFSNSQVKKLISENEELKKDKGQLEKELGQALQAPFKKYEKKDAPENPKKLGAPFGHTGYFRKRPDGIDEYVDVRLEKCPHCGSERLSPCSHTAEHIQEDIESGRLRTTCFIHSHYWCAVCKKVVHGRGANEIPNAFIGPDARAKAAFLRYEIKISYDDVPRVLQNLCGLNVTPGAIVGFDNKVCRKGAPLYEALKETLPETRCIYADETGWKRDHLWIFTNSQIAFYHIDEHRSSSVVRDHLGEFYKGVLITDFYSAYRSLVPAFAKQKCCTHLLRDVKELLDNKLPESPDAEAFLKALKTLVQDAIFLHRQHSILTAEEYRSGRKKILKRFRTLYQHPPLSNHEADNIRKRLIAHKNELFTFLKYPEVEPTNNRSEQGLRSSVIFRKIIFGNRSEQGKKNVSLIMTILRTAQLKMLSPVCVLKTILTEGVTQELLKRFGIPSIMPQAP